MHTASKANGMHKTAAAHLQIGCGALLCMQAPQQHHIASTEKQPPAALACSGAACRISRLWVFDFVVFGSRSGIMYTYTGSMGVEWG